MKKLKTLTAFLLSIALLPTLIACGDSAHTPTDPLPPTVENNSTAEDTTMDSSPILPETPENSSPENVQPEAPPTSTPTPPTQPEAPPVSTPTPPTQPETPIIHTKAQYIRCTGNSVNLRAGAGTNYAVLGTAKEGTIYAIIGKTGSWYKTYYRNKIAYFHTSYAAVLNMEKSKNEDVENVVSEGYKLLGVPYVYGAVRLHDGNGKLLSGFNVQKFDCSSLIQYIFYKGADVLLNVNTRTQVKQGKYVKRDNLQRGDCIFFTNEERKNKTGIERVGHVALYLGNNYILHTASDYACIEQISTKRWSYYIEARRFI